MAPAGNRKVGTSTGGKIRTQRLSTMRRRNYCVGGTFPLNLTVATIDCFYGQFFFVFFFCLHSVSLFFFILSFKQILLPICCLSQIDHRCIIYRADIACLVHTWIGVHNALIHATHTGKTISPRSGCDSFMMLTTKIQTGKFISLCAIDR